MTISSPILFIRPFMCHVLPACLPLPVSLQGQDLPRGRRNWGGKRNDGIRGRTRSCLGCVGHLAPVRRKHESHSVEGKAELVMGVRANRMYVAAFLPNASQSFHPGLRRRAVDDSSCCSTPGNPALSRISRPNGCFFGHRLRRVIDAERIRWLRVFFFSFFPLFCSSCFPNFCRLIPISLLRVRLTGMCESDEENILREPVWH